MITALAIVLSILMVVTMVLIVIGMMGMDDDTEKK